jgi:hypothetical protein
MNDTPTGTKKVIIGFEQNFRSMYTFIRSFGAKMEEAIMHEAVRTKAIEMNVPTEAVFVSLPNFFPTVQEVWLHPIRYGYELVIIFNKADWNKWISKLKVESGRVPSMDIDKIHGELALADENE